MSCRDPGCMGGVLDEGDLDSPVPGQISEKLSGVLSQFERVPEGTCPSPFFSSALTAIDVGPRPADLHGDVMDLLQFRTPGGVDVSTQPILRSVAELGAWNQAYRLTLPRCGLVWRQVKAPPPFQADGSSAGVAA